MEELIICPLCSAVIHRHIRELVKTSIRIPSRGFGSADDVLLALQRRAIEEERQELAEAEEDCVDHYTERHALRYALWKRLRWAWLMRWPQRKPRPALPNQQYFDLTFPK